MKCLQTEKRRGQPLSFTVIELLVAITIISMLVAILMPGLRGAKEQANSVKCMSNLRQIGTAIALFGNDTGYYPPVMTASDPNIYYYSLLSVYLQVPGAGTDDRAISPVFECPSAKKPSPHTNVVNQYAINSFVQANPVLNSTPTYYLPGGIEVESGQDSYEESSRPYPITDRASEIIMMADGPIKANGSTFGFFCKIDPSVQEQQYDPDTADLPVVMVANTDPSGGDARRTFCIRFRHNFDSRANLLYCDGHVASAKEGKILERNLKFEGMWGP